MSTLRSNFNILWRITYGYALAYKFQIALAYISILGMTVFPIATAWVLGNGINSILNPNQQNGFFELVPVEPSLAVLASFIVFIGFLRGASAFGQTFFGESVSQKVAYQLRNKFYNHLQRLDFTFHDKQHTGNLMSKATADIEAVRWFIQAGLIRSSFMLMLLTGIILRAQSINFKLTLVILILVPLVVWPASQTAIRLRRTWLAVQTELGHMTTVLQENLSGQRVVKSFSAENHEEIKFKFYAERVAKNSYEASMLQATNSAMLTTFYIITTALVVSIGSHEVTNGNLSIGELGEFLFLLGLLSAPIRMVAWVVNSFARAIGAGERLFAVLDSESLTLERRNAVKLRMVKGHVRFENVSFSYEDSSEVISNISLDIEASKVVAFLGPPGSGKSTLMHLLPRFYDPSKGQVFIDNHDIRDVTVDSLRANIGIVQQDIFLFTDTIRSNISYSNPRASYNDVVKAAKIAQIHDFIISLPDGYETWVGERGLTLSGGQRQRISIARTMLLDPPILILDDAMSNVDTVTELSISNAILGLTKGRTVFIVASRLSTLKNADLVIGMKEGRIIYKGNYNEAVRLYSLDKDTQKQWDRSSDQKQVDNRGNK